MADSAGTINALFINDDDFMDHSSDFSHKIEEVAGLWCRYLEVAADLEGVFEGDRADRIRTMLLQIKNRKFEDALLDVSSRHSANLVEYLNEIEDADDCLY